MMIDYEVLKRCEEKFLKSVLTNNACGPMHISDKYFSELRRYDKDFSIMDAQQSMTRLFFISDVVSEYIYSLFIEAGIPCLKGETENFGTGEDFSRKNLFEYVFVKDDLRYVVTFENSLPYDESLLIDKYHIALVYDIILSTDENEYIPHGRKEYIKDISLRDFLKDIFNMSREDFIALSIELKRIYRHGLDVQGLNIRKNLNENTMFDFKKKTYEYLLSEFHPRRKMGFYWQLGRKKETFWVFGGDQGAFYSEFLKYGSCLIGEKPFAVSFITAEYLYETLSSNDSIDYSPVILDYIKCVEQLLREVLTYLKIKFNRKTDALKSLAEKLCNNFDEVFIDCGYIVSYFNTILNNFVDCSRNSFIHNNNMSNYELVNKIRKNTHYILFVIIGAFKAKKQDEKGDVLGSFNYDFWEIVNLAKTLRPGLDTVYISTYDNENYRATTVDDMVLTPLKDIKRVNFKKCNTGEIVSFDKYHCPLSVSDIDIGISPEDEFAETYEFEMMRLGLDAKKQSDDFFNRKLKATAGRFLSKYPDKNFEYVKVWHAHFYVDININEYSFEEYRHYEDKNVEKIFSRDYEELKVVVDNILKAHNVERIEHFEDKEYGDYSKSVCALGFIPNYEADEDDEFCVYGKISMTMSFEPREV